MFIACDGRIRVLSTLMEITPLNTPCIPSQDTFRGILMRMVTAKQIHDCDGEMTLVHGCRRIIWPELCE